LQGQGTADNVNLVLVMVHRRQSIKALYLKQKWMRIHCVSGALKNLFCLTAVTFAEFLLTGRVSTLIFSKSAMSRAGDIPIILAWGEFIFSKRVSYRALQ
jgi:hypothetical protein